MYTCSKQSHPSDSAFKKLNILKLSDMVQLEMCKIGYQLKVNDLLDPIVQEFNLCGGLKTHRYPTHHKNLPNIQKHQSKLINQSFTCKSISTFMNLPLEIQCKTSKFAFVKSVKSYIISQY